MEEAEPWATHAKAWDLLSPPFRPCPEDVDRLERSWRDSFPPDPTARTVGILMLGVTPELACHRWSADFRFTALDASEEMVRNVWPGDTDTRRVVLGDWARMPFDNASFDLVLTDCGVTQLGAEGLIEKVGAEVVRVLRPGGRFVFRHLMQETSGRAVGRIRVVPRHGEGFHGFKLRYLLESDRIAGGDGVELAEVWRRFQADFPDRDALAAELGEQRAIVDTMDAYRGRDVRYVFPSLGELGRRLKCLDLRLGSPGTYPLAGVCPVIVGSPKA